MVYPKAFRDMDGIYSYIAIEKNSPEAAKNQTDRLIKAIYTLETFPESHQDRLAGRYAGRGYKQLLVDNYVVIYKVNRLKRTVYIVTVQYQRKNV